MKGKGIFKNCKKAIVCTLSIVAAGCIALAGGAAIAKADTKNVESKTAVSPASLWKIANGVTVSENAKLPEWSINGWRAYQADWVAVVDEYLTEADLPASRTHGVKAVSTSETSRLEYKNIINIDGFTKDDTLVEFVPVSSFRVSTADFTGMKIWITDADDENNWVCINMYAVDAQYGGATRIEAETSTGIDAAYRWGTYHDRTYKSNFYEGGRRDFYNAAYSSYYDKLNDGGRNSLYDLLYEPFSVHYDVEDKSIWVSDYVYGQKKCLLDLDDTGYEDYINSNNAFQGFKNNRVKIAFQTYNIVDTAQYIILNVANNPMNGTQIVDTAAPDALEKLPEGGIPTASVGKPFKTFDIEFYDFFDGAVESKIYAKAEGETDFGEPLSDGVFVPNTQGRYTLRYEAVDKAGNLAVKEYPIFAKYALPPIEIALEGGLPERYFTGEAVAIPQAEISGGSGPLSLDISVVRLSDGKTVEHDGKSFVPYVSGEYCVTYTARDYVGNIYTESVLREIVSQKLPVYVSEPTMYKRFMDGIPVQLPEVEIYDYDSVLGQRVEAVTEIVVLGKDGQGNAVEEKVSDYVFTPRLDRLGDSVTVSYRSYCKKYPELVLKKDFTVEIVKAANSWDYLWSEDDVTIASNTQYEREKYASVTTNAAGDATVQFINPLQAEYFEVQFDSPAGLDLFDGLQLTLTDFIDRRESVSVTVQKDATNPEKTYVVYKGVKREMVGAFGRDAQLKLTYADGKLTDNSGNVVAIFGDDVNFSSGRVWAYVTMQNAQVGACLKLMKIGAHSLFANYRPSATPPLQAFRDTVTPTIEHKTAIVNEAKINEQVTLPASVAYDACTPYMQVFVSVVSPSGKIVFNNVNAAKELRFVTTEYGLYSVVYTATDAAGNDRNASYDVAVYDLTPPVIVYNGASELTYKAGKTVTFASVTAYDAVDDNLTVCLFIISPRGVITPLGADRKYTFTEKGEYTLRYYVYDSNFNSASLNVKITVK